MGYCQKIGFSLVTEDVASVEDLREVFSSVTEGEAIHMDWRTTVVEDPIWETKLLPGDDRGWNASLAKREC